METKAMALRDHLTLWVLRAATRLAWGAADASRALGALGERMEGAIDRHAAQQSIDMTEVLGPLVERRVAS